MTGGQQNYTTSNTKPSPKLKVRKPKIGVKSRLTSSPEIALYLQIMKKSITQKLKQIKEEAQGDPNSDTLLLNQMRLAVISQYKDINQIQQDIRSINTSQSLEC